MSKRSKRWVPLIVRSGPEFDAPSRVAAEAKARRLYGMDYIGVQHIASHQIAEEERNAVRKGRAEL